MCVLSVNRVCIQQKQYTHSIHLIGYIMIFGLEGAKYCITTNQCLTLKLYHIESIDMYRVWIFIQNIIIIECWIDVNNYTYCHHCFKWYLWYFLIFHPKHWKYVSINSPLNTHILKNKQVFQWKTTIKWNFQIFQKLMMGKHFYDI